MYSKVYYNWRMLLKESKEIDDFLDKYQVYSVGGSVRDRLSGLIPHDADYVVIGANAKDMLAAGFQQVGKDFPVFIHPETKEEYALPRTETKTGEGHKGFSFNVGDVSLDQDLGRRDLTINAMAQQMRPGGEFGDIVDPYKGREDLKNKVLRHVSPAFAEDPLRVLRVARFAAKFPDFTIAEETKNLMRQLVQNGEVGKLTPERVWLETEKALSTKDPAKYFEALQETGALNVWFPEVAKLVGVPQPAKYHGSLDAWQHTLESVRSAARKTHDPEVVWAALCHDLGKGSTDPALYPKHYGHDQAGIALVAALCDRLVVPNNFRDLAAMSAEFHMNMHRIPEMKKSTVVEYLYKTDAFRKSDRFNKLLQVCEADATGHAGSDWQREYTEARGWQIALDAAKKVSPQKYVEMGLKGEQIRDRLKQDRVTAVKQALEGFNVPKPTSNKV